VPNRSCSGLSSSPTIKTLTDRPNWPALHRSANSTLPSSFWPRISTQSVTGPKWRRPLVKNTPRRPARNPPGQNFRLRQDPAVAAARCSKRQGTAMLHARCIYSMDIWSIRRQLQYSWIAIIESADVSPVNGHYRNGAKQTGSTYCAMRVSASMASILRLDALQSEDLCIPSDRQEGNSLTNKG
jgi:hypothetical protein